MADEAPNAWIVLHDQDASTTRTLPRQSSRRRFGLRAIPRQVNLEGAAFARAGFDRDHPPA
jgi:hypothetical protein